MPPKTLLLRNLAGNFLKYGLVGGSAAAASVGLLYLSVNVLQLPYLPAFACIFIVVNACAYAASRRFAFRGTNVGVRVGLLRYFAVTGTSLSINSVLLVILVEWVGLSPIVSSIFIGFFNAPLNFLIHRHLTFGMRRSV